MTDKIDKRKVARVFALSPMQENLLFHHIMDPQSEQYFEQIYIHFEAQFDPKLLQDAWSYVVNQNEMLRTVYRWEGISSPVQIVLKESNSKIEYIDWPNDYEQFSDGVECICTEDRKRKFDLRETPIRIMLCEHKPDSTIMIVSYHHILFDGWSLAILMKEFLSAYVYQRRGMYLSTTNKPSYERFIQMIQQKDYTDSIRYWAQYLKEYDNANLFTSKSNYHSADRVVSINFDSEMRSKIISFTRNNAVTLSALIYAAWGLLLQVYSNRNDVVFGTTVSGRSSLPEDLNNVIGLFINTIPLRVWTSSSLSLSDIVKSVNLDIIDRDAHAYMPHNNVASGTVHLLNTSQLFDSIVVVENYPLFSPEDDLLTANGIKVVSYTSHESTNFPVSLQIFSDLEMRLCYKPETLDDMFVGRMSSHFRNIVMAIVNSPELKRSELCVLDVSEIEEVTVGFNNTQANYPKNLTLNRLFEERAAVTPDHIAIRCAEKSWTYHELNCQANRVARVIREWGREPGQIVAIMANRSLEMYAGILGILKAGAAYLPINTAYPLERVLYLLQDSDAKLLLTDMERPDVASKTDVNQILIDNLDRLQGDCSNLEVLNTSKDLAYVIYTSGSTGKPKGVLVEHHSVVNKLYWRHKKYPLSESDVILQKTPYSFDVSVWELFWWMLGGASMCMLEQGDEKFPDKIIQTIEKAGVTVIHFVPSMLAVFQEYLLSNDIYIERISSLKQVFASGEALQPAHIRMFNELIHDRHGTQLHNLYGPTESTIEVTYYKCSAEDDIGIVPIGKPIDNVNLYILDSYGQPQPLGIPGELCIGGAGVARGYLNQPSLTTEKFVPNPFVAGERIYKTGDIAKWMADGNVVFMGRKDNQVKIRGYRIELSEIERTIQSFCSIRSAVVAAKENPVGEKYIVAYISLDDEVALDEVRNYLTDNLPYYMVPSHIVKVDEMPVGLNGKIDFTRLPEIEDIQQHSKDKISEIRSFLTQQWKKVSGSSIRDWNANLLDNGGNSILLMKLYLQVDKSFPGLIKLADLFLYSTIQEVAVHMEMKLASERLRSNYYPKLPLLVGTSVHNIPVEIKFAIPMDAVIRISDTFVSKQLRVEDILMALFVYLLANTADQERMTVHSIIDQKNKIRITDIDFSEVSSFSDLFESIVKSRQKDPMIEIIGVDALGKLPEHIIPLFYKRSFVNDNARLLENHDLSFVIPEVNRSNELNMRCYYNRNKLREEMAHDLVERYVSLIDFAISENSNSSGE